MKKLNKFLIKYQYKLLFYCGLLLTISLLWPLVAAPYFSHHDDVQTIRLYEMDKCIKDFQIPCRWVPDLGGEYGYPLFNYYAPLPYYFGEIFYLITNNLIFSAKVMFAFSFVGSFIFMYLLGRKIWGDLGGFLSALFYSFTPYHAVDFYVRGAMGEMWALMFYPAIFWALFKLRDSVTMLNSLLFAIFLALLMLSHNMSAMIFLPLVIVLVALIFYQRRNFRFIKFVTFSIILGFLLSAFYFMPMVVEKNLVHVETTTSGYFSYTEHFKGLRKLLLDRSWGWGPSVREVPGGEKDGMSFQIGWIHLIGWLIALITAKVLWKKSRATSLLVIFLSIGALGSIFLIHPRSLFIWQLIEPLKFMQFPWRFLMLVTFFISLVCGSVVFLPKGKLKTLLVLLLVFSVVVANFSYFKPEKLKQISDSEFLSGKNWDIAIKRSIFDFLPIYADRPPAELATQRYEVITGDAAIDNYKEGSNWLSFQVEAKDHSIIRLSQYYFPNWKVFINGKEANVEYKNNNLGLMTFILGEGKYEVKARLEDTAVRTVSNLLTLLSLIAIIPLLLTQIPKTRKWIFYYLSGLHR